MLKELKLTRLHAIIEGYVQGVGFRLFVERNAIKLGLSGWVRNLQNGDVEVVAEGERNDLEQLLLSLRSGPRSAVVHNVKVEWQQHLGEFNRFTMRPTV